MKFHQRMDAGKQSDEKLLFLTNAIDRTLLFYALVA